MYTALVHKENGGIEEELSSLVDRDCVSHFAFLCYSAGQELLRQGRQEEARDWLWSVLQVDMEYKITGKRDASVELLIKMAFREGRLLDEKENNVVLNLMELLSSPHDQLLARLDLSTHGRSELANFFKAIIIIYILRCDIPSSFSPITSSITTILSPSLAGLVVTKEEILVEKQKPKPGESKCMVAIGGHTEDSPSMDQHIAPFFNQSMEETNIMQVDGADEDDLEDPYDNAQASIEYCKDILGNLQRDSYDRFQVLNFCEKFELNAGEFTFSKQKLLLQRRVIENIIRHDASDNYKRLLEETDSHLNIKQDSSYKCCLIGCLFSSPYHRKYINHLRTVHVKYNRYLCQFRHKCDRRFSSFDLLGEHMKEVHYNRTKSTSQRGGASFGSIKIPCKCILRSCNGLKFVDTNELVSHVNNYHVDEARVCVFEGCSVRFKPKSASRHHFRLKHVNMKKTVLKRAHLVSPDLAVAATEVDEEDNTNEDMTDAEQIDMYDFDNDRNEENESLEAPVEEEDDDYFVKAFADFMNRMCHMKYVPHSTMQTIAGEFLDHSIKSAQEREKALRKILSDTPEMTQAKIDEIIQKVCYEDKMLKAQKELDTVHKRNSYIRKNFNYVAPVEYVLNQEEVNSGKSSKEVFHYIPLVEAFRNLVEDRSFIEVMEKEREKEKNDKNVLHDIRDGEVYQNVEYFQRNPEALVCIMYSDAVELVNPIGSGRGKHKIVQIFWTLANIPRHQRSQIDRIQLALVIKEKVLRKYGEKIIYKRLVSDLKMLEEGIQVTKPFPKVMKCGLLVHSADNLEAVQVGGFSSCFSSRDVCRWCHIQHQDLVDHIHDYDGDAPHSYWNIEQYDRIADDIEKEEEEDKEVNVEAELNLFEAGEDFGEGELDESKSECSDDETQEDSDGDSENDSDDPENDEGTGNRNRYGLRKRCPFNQLEAFHAIFSFPPDVLHDIFEGVVAQDLCGVIKILSAMGWFDLDQYNQSLKRINYKSFERNDRPQELKGLKGMKLPGKAVSLWTHIRNFAFIIKPFIKDFESQVLALGLKLAEIVERVTADKFELYEVDVFEEKILDYLEHRKLVFEDFPELLGKVKPKHHFLVHYPDAIRKFGPPLSFWTGRFESKHRVAKGTAESAKNFKNISLTISVRQQMRMASVFYNGYLETAEVKYPENVKTIDDLEDDSVFNSSLRSFMGEKDFICNEVVIKSQEYQSGDVVVTKAIDRDNLLVSVIQTILVKNKYILVFSYMKLKEIL